MKLERPQHIRNSGNACSAARVPQGLSPTSSKIRLSLVRQNIAVKMGQNEKDSLLVCERFSPLARGH